MTTREKQGSAKKKDGGKAAVVASAPKEAAFAQASFSTEEALKAAVKAEMARLARLQVSPARKAHWEVQAKALSEDAVRYPGPWPVLLAESVDVAGFVAQRWHPREGDGFKVKRPGLFQVSQRLPYAVAEEIVELGQLAAQAQTEVYLRTRGDAKVDPREEALALLGEISRALTFLFDDGVDDQKDEALVELRRTHGDPDASYGSLAVALESYAGLATKYRDDLAAIGFDVTQLGGSDALVQQLRFAKTTALSESEAEELRALRDVRDRYAALLHQRVRQVRSAAQFVFAAFPKVLREVTSTHQRRARAELRAKAQEVAAEKKDEP